MARPERACSIRSNCTVDYNDSKETRQILYEKVLAWFMEQGMFDGVSITHSDAPPLEELEVSELLCDIADNVFNFKTSWITGK